MLKRAKIDFCKNEKFFNFLQAIDFQRFKTSPRAWAFHTQAKIKIAIHHKNFFLQKFWSLENRCYYSAVLKRQQQRQRVNEKINEKINT